MAKVVSREEVEQWLVARLAQALSVDPSQVGVEVPFVELGLDSGMVVSIAGDLEAWLETRLSPMLLWDSPTIEALAESVTS